MQRPLDIQTERLILRVLLAHEIEWLLAGDAHGLELANGFKYPQDDPNRGVDLGWHLRALRANPKQLPWRIRLIVERSSNTVIDSINLKGPPDAEGDVEIGWGLNEGYRGKGYATEAAAAIIQWAFQQPSVRSVSATVPDARQRSLAASRPASRSYADCEDPPQPPALENGNHCRQHTQLIPCCLGQQFFKLC